MNYGLPYKGSKNKIAAEIVAQLPPAETFVDLFCGGCAVTHAAILSGKYKKFIINDIDAKMPQLFVDAIHGKLNDIYRPISRDEFKHLKGSDPIVATCWSFSNNCTSYLWNEETERLKMEAFRMMTADTVKERHLFYRKFIRLLMNQISKDNTFEIEPLERLQRIKEINNMYSLGRIQSLERMKNLDIQVLGLDYRDVNIPSGSVVYCDIPYQESAQYRTGKFDHERFFEWANTREFPVYISEYSAPDSFSSIWQKEKICTYCATNNNLKTVEKLYVQKRFADKFSLFNT